MEFKEILYIILINWIFVTIITIKICNTIFNIRRINATNELLKQDKSKLLELIRMNNENFNEETKKDIK